MPIVTLKILKGRPKAKLRNAMEQLTEVVSKELDYDRKHVSVYLEEVEHDAFMEGGETGGEMIERLNVGYKYPER
jgi:4-oxalocrotonate tautomerase family enzyme